MTKMCSFGLLSLELVQFVSIPSPPYTPVPFSRTWFKKNFNDLISLVAFDEAFLIVF